MACLLNYSLISCVSSLVNCNQLLTAVSTQKDHSITIVILEKLHKFTKKLPEKIITRWSKKMSLPANTALILLTKMRQRTGLLNVSFLERCDQCVTRMSAISASVLLCFLRPVSSFVIVLSLLCAPEALFCKQAASQTATVKPASEPSGKNRNHSHRMMSLLYQPVVGEVSGKHFTLDGWGRREPERGTSGGQIKECVIESEKSIC